MTVPFLKVCNLMCRRSFRLLAIFVTAFLVLYTIVTLEGDDESAKQTDIHPRRRDDDFAKLQQQYFLDKMVEIGFNGGKAINGTFHNKLFAEAAMKHKGTGVHKETVAGCSMCGETDENVELPITPSVIRAGGNFRTTNSTLNIYQTNTSPPKTEGFRQKTDSHRTNNKTQVKSTSSNSTDPVNRTNVSSHQSDVTMTDETIRDEQERRRARVENVCQNSPQFKYQTLLYRDSLQHVYVVDSQKLIFCYIPKVGCSNWKRILMVLSGLKNRLDTISSKEAHARNRLMRFGSLTRSQQRERLQTYRKVMFVREPLTRVLSAYKNKYRDLDVFRANPTLLRNVAKKIMLKYRPHATAQDLATGENITWNEFTDYLVDPSELPQFDEHWKESYKLCSPCKIKYDFIGKLENIEEEANYVLKKFNFTKQLTYPSSASSHPTNSTSTDISSYFTPFSRSKIQALWNVYRVDYALFGYDKPSFIP